MKERWTEVASDADAKQESQFEVWLSANGAEFNSSEAEEKYRQHATMMKDAIQQKKIPERVPVCPSPGMFPLQYAGMTPYEGMYDYDALGRSWEKYCSDFQPDITSGPGSVVPGRMLDILDFKSYQWPGHGVAKENEYQYLEKEYMKAAEYQDLIDDPSGFFLYKFFPRVFGALESFGSLPMIAGVSEIVAIPAFARSFAAPKIRKALDQMQQAGLEAQKAGDHLKRIQHNIINQGIPIFAGGFTKAPFDVIGDCLRGTTQVCMDMFRHPEELIEACERLTPFMIKGGVEVCKASGHIICFIPLHKGADGFMSNDQYQTFYWPTLKKLIIGLSNEGMVPLLFAEGSYNQRLEIISDIPQGKTIWWFDKTDIVRVKETVGKVACIAGNVPSDILCIGTPDDIKDYCKTLIDVAGKDGGFILSTGASLQDAKIENAKTMIEFSKSYGVYG